MLRMPPLHRHDPRSKPLNSVSPIEPAPLAIDAAGVPYSTRYGDIYHSADSGPGQARHVFLGGNHLPGRWNGLHDFTILETGFGLGLNFLATWQAWRDDPDRSARLNYVSVEKHPFTTESLSSLHGRYGEFAPLSAELREQWPVLVAGIHRISLADGRVLLTLAFGDANEILPKLAVQPDAIYLDGFSPASNPGMWTPTLIKAIARKARTGTTLATYTSAAAVRRALESEGFLCDKRPGFGHKREMIVARFAPRWRRQGSAYAGAPAGDKHALVVGAGLAGAAICERLASRGWRLTLIEASPAPAMGASGLSAGIFHPHVSPDDCVLSRLSRNAYLLGMSRWTSLEKSGHRIEWSRCGVLQLPHRISEEEAMVRTLASLAYPVGYARTVDAAEAGVMAKCRVASGGWWFEGAGWLRASSLVRAELDKAERQLTMQFGNPVRRLERRGNDWHALAQDGSLIAKAPVAILANAADMQYLVDVGTPLRRIRGQVSLVPQRGGHVPSIVVTGMGYVIPPREGMMLTGSTYEPENQPLLPPDDANSANLVRLQHLLPDFECPSSPDALCGESACRAVARDRMPLVGRVPDLEAAQNNRITLTGAQLADMPHLPDLYCATGFGSRGIIWSAMAGELLASLLEHEPLPMESDLAAAIDPGRFALRNLRHGLL